MTHPTRRDALRSLLAGSALLALDPAAALARPAAGELLVRGGRVVNADGSRDADVRVRDGRIVEVGAGLRAGPGATVVEAAGMLVMPGGIDPHAHLQPPFAETLATGTQAALAGGITTVGTFAGPRQGETLLDALARMTREGAAEAAGGLILHPVAWPPTPEVAAALPALAAQGQPSIKIYMVRPDFHAQLPAFVELLEAARAAGILTMVHCEDGALLAAAVRRLTAEGRTALRFYGESRPVVAEVAATELAASLCESTGAPMYVVHLSSERALEVCRRARARDLPFYVETRPLYLHLTEERLQGPDGPLFVGQPPLRAPADREALWQGLRDGSIDVLATDHAPWTRAQKMDPELTVARVRPGASDLQWMLPMYFSEGVGKRGISPERFVATTSANAAKLFGLWPERGVIRAGAVADLAVWDPRRTGRVRAADDLSLSDYSPYEGWEVTGWPTVVVRGGEVAVRDGRVLAGAGSGAVLRRGAVVPPA